MNEPTLLASGRDADVFALDRRRVLRRYRDGGDTAPEAAVMAYLSGAGYPVPEVHSADGPEMVLERLDGETLLDALLAGRLKQAAMGRVFGFEILPAPFVVAHLQLGLFLQEHGTALDEKHHERAAVRR